MSAKPRSVVNVGGFTAGQKQFFEYHRDMVLLKTKLNKDERPPVPRRALSKMPSSQAGRRRFDPGLPLFVSRAYPHSDFCVSVSFRTKRRRSPRLRRAICNQYDKSAKY
jgi:hypothetical protein